MDDEVGSSSSDDDEYVPSEEEENRSDECTDGDDDEEHDNENGHLDGGIDADRQGSSESSRAHKGSATTTHETEEERRRRLDALFDDFIGGGGTSSSSPVKNDSNEQQTESSPSTSTTTTAEAEVPVEKSEARVEADKQALDNGTRTHIEVFDFAGEEVRVERNVPNCVEETIKPMSDKSKQQPINKRSSSGLNDALKLLSKKPRMSVLDKTQHDWTTFKNERGIEDELQSHNRGRQGYVERMAFLNRADYRQFEREREARNAVRNKKQK